MLRFGLLIVALASLALAQEIVSHRDEPLGTTWFAPHKPKEAKGRGGILANRWKCFPSIGQSFAQDKKWLDLELQFAGIGRLYYDRSGLFDRRRREHHS